MMNNHYDSYRYETSAQIISGTRWASEDEVRESLSPVNLYDKHYAACGLPLISDGHTAYVNNTDSHSLIVGSTGSKKSRLFVMPMLEMIARAGESAIVTDPKGELYTHTSGLFHREEYQVLVLNFRDPTHSHGWNPMYTAYMYYKNGQTDKALETFSDLSSFFYYDKPGSKADPFWTQKSRALFQGLSQMLLEDEYFQPSQANFSTIVALMSRLSTENEENTLSIIEHAFSEDSLARSTVQQAMVGSEKTMDNIVTSALSPLQIIFTNKSLLKMLSTPEVDFNTIGLKKSILYIIMPDEKTTLHPLVGMCIKNCYELLIDTAQHQKRGMLPVRVNFLLDEFSNIPTIPDMSSMITAARSRNIRFYLIIQSMQQLAAKYGEEANTLRGNCNDWVFLTSRELTLLRELEELCGRDAQTGEPLISVSQLQRLNKETGEALVLCGRLYPYLSHLADIDQYPFADMEPMPLPALKTSRIKPFRYQHYYEAKMSRFSQLDDLLSLDDAADLLSWSKDEAVKNELTVLTEEDGKPALDENGEPTVIVSDKSETNTGNESES